MLYILLLTCTWGARPALIVAGDGIFLLSGVEVDGHGLGAKWASPSTEFSGKLGRHSPELTLGSWLGHQPDFVLNSGCWPSLSNADCALNCRCWPSLSNADCVLNSGVLAIPYNADCSPWASSSCLSTSAFSWNTPSTGISVQWLQASHLLWAAGPRAPGTFFRAWSGRVSVINNLELACTWRFVLRLRGW